MTTREGLMAAILAAPDDDLPRLVFADWLEENGEAERAEFIRVQCELAKLPLYKGDYANCRNCDGDGYSEPPPYHRICRPCNGTGKKDHANYTRNVLLRRRESELLTPTSKAKWFDGLMTHPASPNVKFRRGIVDEVECTLADWCGHNCHQCAGTGRSFPIDGPSIPCRRCGGALVTGIGPTVLRASPVTRVAFRGKEPRQIANGGVVWEPGFDYSRPHQVSFAIAEAGKWRASMINGLMVYKFPTTDSAIDAMSAAAIQWAKSVTPGEGGVQQRTEELA